MASPGFVARALAAGIVDLVHINEVKSLSFLRGRPGVSGLGVRGLSACSVVVIVSDLHVIVAHIGPNILGSTDPRSHLLLAEQKMDEVVQHFRSARDHFTDGAQTYVMCATFGGSPTSPEQKAIIQRRIEALGLHAADTSYTRPALSTMDGQGPAGTVWIDGRQSPPRVYLEDTDVTQKIQTNTSSVHNPTAGVGPSADTNADSSGVWIVYDGRAEYFLVGPNRTVLDRRPAPPANVWIQHRSATGQVSGPPIRWNGRAWETWAG